MDIRRTLSKNEFTISSVLKRDQLKSIFGGIKLDCGICGARGSSRCKMCQEKKKDTVNLPPRS